MKAVSFPSLSVSVLQLMQECGDILDKEDDDKPSVDVPSTISEDTDDPPPVPCQTEDSLKLVQESSYDVPGFTYDIPKSPTEKVVPPQQLSSSLLPPVGETPPPIPTTKPPQRSSSPQPGHTPSSGSSGPSLGTGGGSAKVKGLKNLFNSKKVCDLFPTATLQHHTREGAQLLSCA